MLITLVFFNQPIIFGKKFFAHVLCIDVSIVIEYGPRFSLHDLKVKNEVARSEY